MNNATKNGPGRKRKESIVVWRGPSNLNGAPIEAILSFGSRNTKTGDLAQLWILPTSADPAEAQRTGEDAAVCGDCPMRPAHAEMRRASGVRHGCYVKTSRAPLSTWRAARRKRPDLASAVEAVRGLKLRLGAYGDPAALPEDVIRALCGAASGWTGYTHSPSAAPYLRGFVMASAETTLDSLRLRRQGWRTFRQGATGPGEVTCPATTHDVQCADCMLCDGSRTSRNTADRDNRKSVAIANHQ